VTGVTLAYSANGPFSENSTRRASSGTRCGSPQRSCNAPLVGSGGDREGKRKEVIHKVEVSIEVARGSGRAAGGDLPFHRTERHS
jgi:hypothetical protein